METAHSFVHDGKITVPAPASYPEGVRVRLQFEVDQDSTEKWGIDESELHDDPKSIEEWCRWIDTLEPIDFPPEDEFDRKFREFQIEAVRRQIEENRF